MSSLAILAHGGHAKAPAFNAIFYATVATVIPVLFVGLALQADTYAEMLKTARAATHRLGAATGLRDVIRWQALWVITAVIPVTVLIYGVWGEIQAFLDLYLQRPVGAIGPLKAVGPLIAVVTLTLIAGIGPATRLVSAGKEIAAATREEARKQQPPLPGKAGGPAGQASA